MMSRRALPALVVVALLAVVGLVRASGQLDESPRPGPETDTEIVSDRRFPAGDAAVSGLPTADLDQLPIEAADTVGLVLSGGPYPFERDGTIFQNREGLLPERPSGYWPLALLEAWHPELLAGFGYEVDIVDLGEVTDKQKLMSRMAAALDLPGWFGHNWDALDDALGDRYSRSARVLVLNHYEALIWADASSAATLLQVIGDALAGSRSLALAVGGTADSHPAATAEE